MQRVNAVAAALGCPAPGNLRQGSCGAGTHAIAADLAVDFRLPLSLTCAPHLNPDILEHVTMSRVRRNNQIGDTLSNMFHTLQTPFSPKLARLGSLSILATFVRLSASLHSQTLPKAPGADVFDLTPTSRSFHRGFNCRSS
jgi:hypothetical protein